MHINYRSAKIEIGILFLLAVTICGTLLLLDPRSSEATSTRSISTYKACSVSDATSAVQKALDDTASGDTLIFDCMANISRVFIVNRSNITIGATNGGGVNMLSQTSNNWDRALDVVSCSSCVIKDLVFEGNMKDMVAFRIANSKNSTISGLTIRNIDQAGTAFETNANDGNKYLNNTIQNVGLSLSPASNDVARGMWLGDVGSGKETNAVISGNTFSDISGSALAVHGSGTTISNNNGTRLNYACIKVLPLGGSGSPTIIENNSCSGVGAKWLAGGGMMTEYYNSSNEQTIIRNNNLEGYADADVSRLPASGFDASVGINIANPPSKITRNVQILNNSIKNFWYDSIQISGPADNVLIEGNLIERTVNSGKQWNGIALQGNLGKVITNVTARNNVIRGKTDGFHLDIDSGSISGITLENNSITNISRNGVHVEVYNGTANAGGINLSNNCFASVSGRTVWDNRSSSPLAAASISSSCSNPATTPSQTSTTPAPAPSDTLAPAVSITTPSNGAVISGLVTATANASDNVGVAGVQFLINNSPYSTEDTSPPYTVNWITTDFGNMNHTISARARDTSGNITVSSIVPVTVRNGVVPAPATPATDITAPTVAITSPISNSTISGIYTVTASASDNVGVAGVQFKINNTNYGSEDTTVPYSIAWISKDFGNSSHTVSATARDAAGNTKNSNIIGVVVNNATTQTPPPLPPPTQTSTPAAPTITTVSSGSTSTGGGGGGGSSSSSRSSNTVSLNTVRSTDVVNVRSAPSLRGSVLGKQIFGSTGTFTGESIYADGHTWWKIDFSSGQDGYVASNYLQTTNSSVEASQASIRAQIEVLQKRVLELLLLLQQLQKQP